MALIWLPDVCDLPNTAGKRKRRVGEDEAFAPRAVGTVKVVKGDSFTSDSCSGSSRSKASMHSTASSRCSFPAVVSGIEDDGPNGRVRIAIGGM